MVVFNIWPASELRIYEARHIDEKRANARRALLLALEVFCGISFPMYIWAARNALWWGFYPQRNEWLIGQHWREEMCFLNHAPLEICATQYVHLHPSARGLQQ